MSTASNPVLLTSRRDFLQTTMLGALGIAGCATRSPHSRRAGSRLFFTSAGRTFTLRPDGTELAPLEVEAPLQVTWQPAGFLADGRVLLLSMEARRDGPGKPFEEYYHQTPTHLWAYDLEQRKLEELATRDRLAPFYTPQLVLQDGRLLVQVIRTRPGQIYNMRLDGSDAREFTQADEGLPYGFSLSPAGQRVAFHLAGPKGYQIWTCNTVGGERRLIAGHPERLYFGPSWSPDGQWLVFQSCEYRRDPGHDWSDVFVARADSTDVRAVTTGQSMWFGATYGVPGNRGGGSNVAVWSKRGRILFPRRSPGAQVPWQYQADRPDTDHFNREYVPEHARGGTAICTLDPKTGAENLLTPVREGTWDFRCTESPDGQHIAFCRARDGEVPELWIMKADGSHARRLTQGFEDRGADHPRWG